MKRTKPLVDGEVYHIFNRSIGNYRIFNNDTEYSQMLLAVMFYKIEHPPAKLSYFLNRKENQAVDINQLIHTLNHDQDKLIDIVAYCLMPTHTHFILKQLKTNGISIFMGNIQNSFSHFFNMHHHRKGPLWESKFKNIVVENDNQLLHLTRYIHLNPTSAGLVKKPEKWKFSSYLEYLNKLSETNQILSYDNLLEIKPSNYQKFVNDRKDYQQKLSIIKKLIL